jgi:hypothetical protein
MMIISGINHPGFIYQSKEFSGAGLSPEIFLSYNDWIGSEELRFFVYHMKRTAGSMVIHSLLPAGNSASFKEILQGLFIIKATWWGTATSLPSLT